MKKLLTFILLISFTQIKAESLDSLFSSLKNQSPTEQVEVLHKVYKRLQGSDSNTFFSYHHRALQLQADQKTKQEIVFIGRLYEARWHGNQGREAESITMLTKLVNDLDEKTYPDLKARTLTSLSHEYHEIGSVENALKYSLDALNCLRYSNDSTFLPKVLNAVGEDYRTMNKMEEAVHYYDQGFAVAMRLKDSLLLGMISSNKGIALSQLSRYDEAESILKFGYEITVKTGDTYGQAILLTNLGFNAKNSENYQPALDYYARSLEIKEAFGNKKSIAYTLNDIGETYSLSGDYERAIRYSLKALKMIDEVESPYYMRDFKLTLANAYYGKQQFDSAFVYLNQSRLLQEKLLNDDNIQEAARIEQLHILREKDLENNLLKAENEASLSELYRGRWLFAFVSLLLIAASTIGFVLYRNNRIKQAFSAKLEAQNMALLRTNEHANQLLNEQNSLFNIVTHDLKGPLLNSAQLLNLESEAETSAEKEKLRSMIHRSVNGALGFISEFNVLRELEERNELPKKELFDLTSMIAEVLDHYKSALDLRKIQVHFNASQKIEVESTPSYVRHILLNLISNAIKFSTEKGSIFITVSQSQSTRISIEDQGVGIPEENLDRIFERFFRTPAGFVSSKSNGLGLSLVKLLIEKLGGKITVKSTVNKGSEFIVHIP